MYGNAAAHLSPVGLALPAGLRLRLGLHAGGGVVRARWPRSAVQSSSDLSTPRAIFLPKPSHGTAAAALWQYRVES